MSGITTAATRKYSLNSRVDHLGGDDFSSTASFRNAEGMWTVRRATPRASRGRDVGGIGGGYVVGSVGEWMGKVAFMTAAPKIGQVNKRNKLDEINKARFEHYNL